MSAYTDRIDAARNKGGNLYRQIMAAIAKAAQDVAVEDPQTAEHEDRLAWSERVRSRGVAGLEHEADRFLVRVLENATIAADPEAATDNDVQFVVNSLVNDFIRRG